MSKVANQRTRNWTFVVYPDSAPENWQEILRDLKVQGFISPLHKDVNPDETEKKPHYHVFLMFDSVKTFEQIKEITEKLNSPHPQYVQSKSGMARYLCHLDNPEKVQYKPEDVVNLGAADYIETIATAADLDRTITEMEEWCDENGVFSYAGLCRYARKNRPDWTRALRYRCTVHMKAYLQCCQWEMKNGISYDFNGDEKKSADHEAYDPSRVAMSEAPLHDANGNRILVCGECGFVGEESDFSTWGGEMGVNIGRCNRCEGGKNA